MIRAWPVTCALCILCGSCFSLDRTAFTFLHYNLEVRVDPAGNALAARGKILLRNDSKDPQRNLTLQISSTLKWRMIEMDGKELEYLTEPYTTDIDHTGAVTEAVVTLPNAAAPKAIIELEVGYQGTVKADAMRLTRIGVPEDAAKRTDWDQIADPVTKLRGIGYVTWYPVSIPAGSLSDNSVFAAIGNWKNSQAKSRMRVNLCWISETNLAVVANGKLEGTQRKEVGAGEDVATNAGCSDYSFDSIGWTVPTFAVGQYTTLSRPAIAISYLGLNQGPAQEYALAAEKVLPFETAWFGAPREKVHVVELPAADAPFDAGSMLLTPLAAGDRKGLEVRMIHQLVHASAPSPRPWIAEGLANFGQALEREQQDGRNSAVAYMQAMLPTLAQVETASHGDQAIGIVNTGDEVLFRIKAMFIWWMLRDMVGDALLQRVLKTYRASDDKNTGYVQHLFEQATGQSLEKFFDDWVYRDRGLPDFRVESAFPRATLSSAYVVTVTIENLGAVGAEVPVIVRTASGDKEKRMFVPAKSKAVDRIEVAAPPTEVVVNDGSVPESDTSNNSLAIPQRDH